MFPIREPGLPNGVWPENGSPASIELLVDDGEKALQSASLPEAILLNCLKRLEFSVESFSRHSSLRYPGIETGSVSLLA